MDLDYRISLFLRHILFLVICFSAIFAGSPIAKADKVAVSSLSELEDQKLFLGDSLELATGTCWASKKPTGTASKNRLQIFLNNKWVSVGRSKYVAGTQCTGNAKKIYEQIFVWEVDRLGEIDNRFRYLGTLRLRNIASSPSEYVKVTILESRNKLREFEASQNLDFENWFYCQMKNGQWDQSRGLCIGGNP